MMHQSVLTREVQEELAVSPDNFFFDATFGSGGHTQAIARNMTAQGQIVACDVDPQAIADGQKLCEAYDVPITLVQSNFVTIKDIVTKYSTRTPDAILADLGWRIEQFEAGERGLSFAKDEPLLMTYGTPSDYLLTARDIVNEWAEKDIANVLFGYGEERYARKIASAIVAKRQLEAIETTQQLVSLIESTVPNKYSRSRIHPATKTFQALRIAVNNELEKLDQFIDDAWEILRPSGRLSIISFHSLEDRIVKQKFKELYSEGLGELHYKKPTIASDDECTSNPRARSAKLRTITKL